MGRRRERDGKASSGACDQKAGKEKSDIRYLFAGDLLGQLIATTFGVKDMDIPIFGLYGACSTCGEGLSLAAMTVAAGYADYAVSATSSHYGSAEKQFRFPLEYGNQRPLSATWTVTGSGAFVIGSKKMMMHLYLSGSKELRQGRSLITV